MPGFEYQFHRARQLYCAILFCVIDENEYLFARAHAAADLNPAGHRAEHRSDARFLDHPFGSRRHQLFIEHRANVGDPSLPVGAREHRRLIVEPAIALAILQEHFIAGRQTLQLVGPDAGFSAAPCTRNRKVFFQSVILVDTRAQGVHEVSRLALWQ